ncbi:MAG: heme o synthase, partial [Thermoplasmata archaeon]|nr:heme o synthase [Thermoplasmata archaeon]
MSTADPSPPPHAGWRDYATLTKPGITGLIVLVAVAGFFLAQPGAIDLRRLGVLVVTGATASAGAAMLNHYLDRDLDAQMRRTRQRPIPGARIDPSERVALAGVVLSVVAVGSAAWLLNPLTGFSIALGGITYVVVYTLWLKRRSSWNIVIGGFAGSAPALAGSAAAVGSWTPGVLAFALLVFLWTPPHFWSLALLLRNDYAAAGLPMLPRMDDPGFSGKVVVVSAALLVPSAALLGFTHSVAWPVTLALVALGIVFVVLTAPLWKEVTKATARRGFIYSGPYLLLVVVALVANAWLVRIGVPTG